MSRHLTAIHEGRLVVLHPPNFAPSPSIRGFSAACKAEKSIEITAIPELFSTLVLSGCTITIDAKGTQTSIAEVIQERGADYVLVP